MRTSSRCILLAVMIISSLVEVSAKEVSISLSKEFPPYRVSSQHWSIDNAHVLRNSLTRKNMRVAGHDYSYGLMLHVNDLVETGRTCFSEVYWNLDGAFSAFKCSVGFDDHSQRMGAASITIYGDGQKLQEVTFAAGDLDKMVDIPVRGVRQLQVRVVVNNFGTFVDLVNPTGFREETQATQLEPGALARFPGTWSSSTGSTIKITDRSADTLPLEVWSNGKLVGSSVIHIDKHDQHNVWFSYRWQGATINGVFSNGRGEGVRVWDGTGWEASWRRL
ncbi:MAG: NPCBM/NEW2 domain-containing protein [Vulcanimicrobiota bacterium]